MVEAEKKDSCLTCQFNEKADPELGGVVWENENWRVEHSIGKTGEGAMILKAKTHVEWLDERNEKQLTELGVILGNLTRAIRDVTGAERVYVNLWNEASRHVHFVLQPVTQELRDAFGGLKASHLQSAMATEDKPINKERAKELSNKIGQKLIEVEAVKGAF